MPFTAFHLGAALFGKGLAPKSQSILFFGAVTAAIDLEPAIKMLAGSTAPLHQITHSPYGLLTVMWLCIFAWRWAQTQSWWGAGMPVLSWSQLFWTGSWAAFSHWFLDAMSHEDIAGSLAQWYGIEAAQDAAIGLGLWGLVFLAIRWVVSAAARASRRKAAAR